LSHKTQRATQESEVPDHLWSLAVETVEGRPIGMIDPAEVVADFLNGLGEGKDLGSALCNLTEAGAQVSPFLVAAYGAEKSPRVRAGLVRAIGEHRQPQSLPFLAKVLDDPNPEVRNVALDGLVTIGGPGAREILEFALLTADSGDTWQLGCVRPSIKWQPEHPGLIGQNERLARWRFLAPSSAVC
jgi:HEAT repeat protein